MTYIENIFLCLAIPMILSLFFIRGRSRSYTLFVTIGMGICLLSAYVNSFFMWLYGVDGTVAAIDHVFSSVQFSNSFCSCSVVFHFDESESFGFTGFTVHNNFN